MCTCTDLLGQKCQNGAHTVKLSSAVEVKVFLFCDMLIVTSIVMNNSLLDMRL